MYDVLSVIEMGFCLILFLIAWMAVHAAMRLRHSGSAPRLRRKSRTLLARTAWLTLPALVIFYCIGWFASVMPELYWKDRILLDAPLIGAPLLAIWFTTVPMLWGLWRYSDRNDGLLDPAMRAHLYSRLYVLPYQAIALGAGTSFLSALTSPVPYDRLKVAAPLAFYVVVMIGLWMHHDHRFVQLRDWLRSRREAKSRTQA